MHIGTLLQPQRLIPSQLKCRDTLLHKEKLVHLTRLERATYALKERYSTS